MSNIPFIAAEVTGSLLATAISLLAAAYPKISIRLVEALTMLIRSFFNLDSSRRFELRSSGGKVEFIRLDSDEDVNIYKYISRYERIESEISEALQRSMKENLIVSVDSKFIDIIFTARDKKIGIDVKMSVDDAYIQRISKEMVKFNLDEIWVIQTTGKSVSDSIVNHVFEGEIKFRAFDASPKKNIRAAVSEVVNAAVSLAH